MLASDWNMAVAIGKYWEQGGELPAELCPLVTDLDRLLSYLDSEGFSPGDALTPCPACGKWHRWTFFRELLGYALRVRPASSSRLLQQLAARQAESEAIYGGKEEYEKYLEEADAYFKKVGAESVYKV